MEAIHRLKSRLKQLGMTYDVVAKRSHTSRATVERFFRGQSVGFDQAQQIAQALGVAFQLTPLIDVPTMREQQGEFKARQLVAQVQGTSALEGQAVPEDEYEAMVWQTKHQLLAGSKRRLWG